MIPRGNGYNRASFILALMALLWIPGGYYLFEMTLPYDFNDFQGVSHWGSPFYAGHSGVILLLSGLGVILGVVGRKKYRVWPVGLFINVIVFDVVLVFPL